MAYAAMFERWWAVLDGRSFEVLLDLGRGEDYPVPGYAWFLGIRIPMADARDDGLPTHTEEMRLNAVEDRIRALVRARDGIYVGRRTGGANRDLICYMPGRPAGLEDRVRASIGMEILFNIRRDDSWAGYESMLPSAREWRQIEDLKCIDALVNADAVAELLHRVEHRVSTSSAKGAKALEKLFKKLELSDTEVDETGEGYIVSGVQETPLALDPIHRVSWILESRSPKARGEYLGWSALPELATS